MAAETTGASGLAGRYATALFELAEDEGKLDEVAQDLAALDTMLRESEDFMRMIRSPVLARNEQVKAITAVCEAAGLGELTRRFVGTVAANRRLFALPAMIKAYRDVLARSRGEERAEVVSAQPLSESQVQALNDALKKAIGSAVDVETRVDPGILGGLIVRVGSRMIDSSLKTKLSQLRLAMKGVG